MQNTNKKLKRRDEKITESKEQAKGKENLRHKCDHLQSVTQDLKS